jgi:hypothetical protein
MNSTIQFSLTQSGYPFSVPNEMQNTGNLSVTYTPAGGPTSLSISIEGIVNSTGSVHVLDSFSGTTSTTRSVSLGGVLYDSFKFTPMFSGGNNVLIAANVTSSGAGEVFSSSSLPAVQSYGPLTPV